MSEYRFERLTDENLPDLISLAINSFGFSLPLENLKKKFDTSWCGLKNVGYIAYDSNGNATAYYGVFPCLINYQGKIILAAQSGDTMTHSKHRGKGLFVTLAKMTYQLAKENGVKIIFGFPNENSYHGFVTKLDWIHKEDMHLYKIKVSTLPIAKLIYKLKFLKPIYDKYLKFFLRNKLSKKTYFDNYILEENTGSILRDAKFFDYKKYSDKFIVEVLETAVWIKIDGFLYVGDMEKIEEIKFFRIINKLKKTACFLGASEIVFQASPHSNLDKLLSKKYSFQKGAPIGYLNLSEEVDGGKLKFTLADFDTF